MDDFIVDAFNTLTNNIDKANSLNEKIDLINQNVQFNITTMWAMLAVIVGVIGVALYQLTKMWVNTRVEKELDERLNIIRSDIKLEMVDFIKKNPQTLYAHGTISPTNTELKGNDRYASIHVYLGDKVSLFFPTVIEVYYKQDNKIIIAEEVQPKNAENNLVEIRYKIPQSCVNLSIVYWNITWQNELYR